MTETTALIDIITRGGLLSALIIALLGGMKGWYIWGGQHKDMMAAAQRSHDDAIKEKAEQLDDLKKDRDYWRNQAMTTLSATGRIANVVEATSRKQE